MLEKIRFVLGWVKYNRSMTFVYITVLSFIACSNLLLMQFFYNESTYDENGTYFYCFYFDKSMKLETAEKILNDLDKSGIDVLEYAVAVEEVKGYEKADLYAVCSYLVLDEEQNKIRSEYFNSGKFENKANTCVGDQYNQPLVINNITFSLTGEYVPNIGNRGCDYLINASDYKKYISTVDVIEVTLTKRNRDAVVKVINQYDANYSSVFSDGIMESGLKSIRDTVIVSAVLMLVSFYSALAFVEMFVHFQKKDIAVFYRCGAKQKDIQRMYFGEVALAGVISFLIGAILANVVIKIIDFNYNKLNALVYVLAFIFYMVGYLLEAWIYIRVTVKHVSHIFSDTD